MKRETGYLATIKKLKTSTEVKETASVIKSCQKTSAKTKTAVTNYSICIEQTNFTTSKCETESGKKKFGQSKCIILHALRKLRNKRARKTFIVQADLKVRFHTHKAQSVSCHELLVVFGLSKLNSNWTNHKPRKKQANQKRWHMSLRLCRIRTRYCVLICRHSYTEGLEHLRHRQSLCHQTRSTDKVLNIWALLVGNFLGKNTESSYIVTFARIPCSGRER